MTKGIIPIAKSTSYDNLKNNIDCFFNLKEDDVERINKLNKNVRLGDPSTYAWAGYLNLFD